MTIEKILYKKTFNLGNYSTHTIGIEIGLDAGEDAKEAIKTASDLCHEYHKESFEGYGHEHIEVRTIPDIQVEKEEQGKSLEEMIMSCTEFKVLESYYLIVKNNPALQNVYDIRKKQLTDIEVKQILEKTDALLPKHTNHIGKLKKRN